MLTYSLAVKPLSVNSTSSHPFAFFVHFPLHSLWYIIFSATTFLCSEEPLFYFEIPQDCTTLCAGRIANNSWYWISVLVLYLFQIYPHHLILIMFIISFQRPYLANFLSPLQIIWGVRIRNMLIAIFLWILKRSSSSVALPTQFSPPIALPWQSCVSSVDGPT